MLLVVTNTQAAVARGVAGVGGRWVVARLQQLVLRKASSPGGVLMCWYMCALFAMAKAMPYVSLSPYMNSYKWPLLNAFRNHVHSSTSAAATRNGDQSNNGQPGCHIKHWGTPQLAADVQTKAGSMPVSWCH